MMKMKCKSMLSLLLALLLVLGLSACGGKAEDSAPASPATTESAKETATSETTDATPKTTESASEMTGSALETTGSAKEPGEQPAVEGTLLETEFWSLTYSDDWTIAEGDLREDEGHFSAAELYIGDRDNYELHVFIAATVEGPDDYRDNLQENGKNLYDLVENGSETPEDIGGVNCYSCDRESWGEAVHSYYGRDEASGTSVEINIYGPQDDPRIEELLSTLQFTLEDVGNVDPAWPWNGEPFIREGSLSKMIGAVNLSASQVVLDESLVANDIFSGRIVMAGQDAYVLCDNTLKQYTYDGQKLSFVQDIPLDDEYEEMCVGPDGAVYLSDFGSPLIAIKDGAKVLSFDDVDYAALAPDATWGISFFTSPDIEKFTISGGTISSTAYTLAEFSLIDSVNITANHIFISGNTVANEETGIAVYDLSLNLQMMLGDKEYGEPDCLGSITWVGETANGIVAIDGNARDLCFWTADGTFIGSADSSELFDADYPWMSGAAICDDGSMLICLTQERDDSSADEYVVFRLTGF